MSSKRQHVTAMAAHSWRASAWYLALAAGLTIGQAGAAPAATFSVNPVQIFLSAATKSALLTLKNETDQPIRFQLSVNAWAQDPGGQMQLAPTTDIVFFPAMLTLQAHEERKVRIGATVPPGSVEKTYRIFVEELPPLEKKDTPAGVTMLTKMGIPIFLQPAKPVGQAAIREVGIRDGHLGFTLQNNGNVYFLPKSVGVRGLNVSGDRVMDQKVDAWYVLAGTVRVFDVAIPAPQCGQVRSLAIEVQVSGSVLKETLQTPGGACGR
jgi:fimbrial chaperone protein